jgi:hypothetical protein
MPRTEPFKNTSHNDLDLNKKSRWSAQHQEVPGWQDPDPGDLQDHKDRVVITSFKEDFYIVIAIVCYCVILCAVRLLHYFCYCLNILNIVFLILVKYSRYFYPENYPLTNIIHIASLQ